MCGIAGICGIPDVKYVGQVRRMMAALRHRGPDGAGIMSIGRDGEVLCDKSRQYDVVNHHCPTSPSSVTLGHLRLAILDLSDAGLQPMPGQDGQDYIIFNGEIYNFLELRQELIGLDHSFYTCSDTEVLLAAYRQWGREMLGRLNGMFSFAIADLSRRLLFCARDRFGEKPFYYWQDQYSFVFASEIKALLEAGAARDLNPVAAMGYLAAGSTHFGQDTFFRQIHELPAGHGLEVRWDEPGRIHVWPYYNLPGRQSERFVKIDDYVEQFGEHLRDSVRLRLRADVPVGSCLSGGLDSSAVVSQCLQLAQDSDATASFTFQTFNAVPDKPGFSEYAWAEKVVAGKKAVINRVDVTASGLAGDLVDLIHTQDEPFSTLSVYLQYCIMRTARQRGIPVLMDGQGGDEILLGYERMYGVYLAELVRRGKFRLAQEEFRSFQKISGLHALKLAGLMLYSVNGLRRFWRQGHQAQFLNPNMRTLLINNGSDIPSGLFARQKHELLAAPLPSLLRYEDRNAMRFSIETRLPFLDHRLVEFCLTAPVNTKLHEGWTKWMMRAAMDGVVPPEVAWRRDKKGFAAPDADWLAFIKDDASDLLGSAAHTSGFYYRTSPFQLFKKSLNGNPRLAWRILCLELWMREFHVSF